MTTRRLVLYSDFNPPRSAAVDDRLLALLEGTRHRIGYIPSESDLKRRYFERTAERYLELGISELSYFDLGTEYDANQVKELVSNDAIHLSGGDPTHFLYLIQQRNFAPVLRDYVARGGILIGVSAGAMLMARSIASCYLFEECRVKLKDMRGLGLIDFEFFPHFEGDAKTVQKLTSYGRKHKVTIYGASDDGGIVVEGDTVELIGAELVSSSSTLR